MLSNKLIPFVSKKFATKKLLDLQHHTRNIRRVSFNPGRNITRHMRALLASGLKRNTGLWLELAFIDELLNFKNTNNGKTLNPAQAQRIKDVLPPKNADIDLLIVPRTRGKGPYLFFLKSSFRERWKQFDRDAIIAKFVYTDATAIGVIYMENQNKPFEVTENKIKDTMKKVHSIDRILSVVDETAVLDLFNEITDS